MVVISDKNGKEIKYLDYKKTDFDLGDTKDFNIVISADNYDENIKYGNRVFMENTEYGGIIGGIETNTSENTITLSGYCFRGILGKQVIVPPKNQAYKKVSGELNTVIKNLINDMGISSLFNVSDIDTGISVTNFQFDRYCTLLDGLVKLLKSKNYKLQIKYIQGEKGTSGYVELSAVPVMDYSDSIEFSQDSNVNFSFKEIKNGVNHLICLGKGELIDRIVIDLYVDKNGNIGTTKYFKGLDEITEVYEDTNSESSELKENGIEKLQEIMNMKIFKMDVSSLNIDIDIGDIVGGRDYITGNSLKSPIINKIYTDENGIESIEYKIEGDDVK